MKIIRVITLILCLNEWMYGGFLVGYERGFHPSLNEVSLGAQMDVKWNEMKYFSLNYLYSWRTSTSYFGTRFYSQDPMLFNQYSIFGMGFLIRHQEGFVPGMYLEIGIGLFKRNNYFSVDLVYRVNIDFALIAKDNIKYPIHGINVIFNVL